MDITYIPMARGFVYLAVVLDWFSRRRAVMARIDHDGGSILRRALEDALARHGKPEISNTDQGSQFTGAAFTGVLIRRDRCQHGRQGLAGQRVRRAAVLQLVKYEEVYLRAYEGVSDARASIGRYLDFYNGRRPHSGLDGKTPDHAYFTLLPPRLAA